MLWTKSMSIKNILSNSFIEFKAPRNHDKGLMYLLQHFIYCFKKCTEIYSKHICVIFFPILNTCSHMSDRLSACRRCSNTFPSSLSEVTQTPKNSHQQNKSAALSALWWKASLQWETAIFKADERGECCDSQQPQAWSPSTDPKKDPGDLR